MLLSNRFVFIAGLHRSGTSILARLLGEHPAVSAIQDAPVPENEGCYLQGAIAHTALHGIPGHFATDPAQHHTESSAFNTLATKDRMLADWRPWFNNDKPWWLEKSPVNLTRTRLYQQLFPTSQFIVILRHPLALAAAMAKWVDMHTEALLTYVLDAYDLFFADLPYLHAAMVIRYEDLVAHPQGTCEGLFAFLGLECMTTTMLLRDGNADYDLGHPLTAALADRMERLGYRAGGELKPWVPCVSHPLRSVRESTLRAITRDATSVTQQGGVGN